MENITSKTTFWKLINQNRISIPIIQRDYAQGRVHESARREKFLNEIYKHLCEDDQCELNLDFVYGKTANGVFYPIDGQQRLTTLFLLHWYFAIVNNVSDVEKEILKKFVYDTRITSREFTQAILSHGIQFPNSKNKIKNITESLYNKAWFRKAWMKDATVRAMLNTIESIHDKFKGKNCWEVLIKTEAITFDVLDLGAKGFELTDQLYIKMNARGKQLTKFENFKASFIKFLDVKHPDFYVKAPFDETRECKISEYFAHKIETDWTDLFWKYRGNVFVLDDLFFNFFDFITQMCFLKNPKNNDYSFDKYEVVFEDKDNLSTLLNSLDWLHNMTNSQDGSMLDEFFSKLLFNGVITDDYSGQIGFFGANEKSSVNLFVECITKSDFGARNKILLFTVLVYTSSKKIFEVNDDLKCVVRMVRNLLYATRQNSETEIITNVRLNSFGAYWKLFRQIIDNNLGKAKLDTSKTMITKSSLKSEIKKIRLTQDNPKLQLTINKLEEFEYFHGMIDVLDIKKNSHLLEGFSKAIPEIWKEDDSLIIRAMIACGFEGKYIKDCSMGELWFFGHKGNWWSILTDYANKETLTPVLVGLLEKYQEAKGDTTEKKLNSIINEAKLKHTDTSKWEYYFLRYQEFTESETHYYAWNNNFEIQMLNSISVNPLLAYHVNPYVKVVINRINNNDIIALHGGYAQYSYNPHFSCKDIGDIASFEEGWWLWDEGSDNDGEYLMLTEGDRIELLVDYISKSLEG